MSQTIIYAVRTHVSTVSTLFAVALFILLSVFFATPAEAAQSKLLPPQQLYPNFYKNTQGLGHGVFKPGMFVASTTGTTTPVTRVQQLRRELADLEMKRMMIERRIKEVRELLRHAQHNALQNAKDKRMEMKELRKQMKKNNGQTGTSTGEVEGASDDIALSSFVAGASAIVDEINVVIDELVSAGVLAYAGEGEVLQASTTATSTYKAYVNGTAVITIVATESAALGNCMRQVAAYPNRNVRCTWGARTIYDNGLPYVKVLAPNGGEKVQVQASSTSMSLITFEAVNLSSFSLALYKNNTFVRWIVRNADKGAIGSQGYVWTHDSTDRMRAADGAVYKIMVQGNKADGTVIRDFSDAPFSFVLSSGPVGKYELYLNGNLSIVTERITEAEALANCRRNANQNPGARVSCFWAGTLIYGEPLADRSIAVEFISSSEELQVNDGNDNDMATFMVRYRVTAQDDDIYVSRAPIASSTPGNGNGVFYLIDEMGAATSTGVLTSVVTFTTGGGASSASGNRILIEEGEYADIALTVMRVNSHKASDDGIYRMSLRGIGWALASSPTRYSTYTDLEDFKTDYLFMN